MKSGCAATKSKKRGGNSRSPPAGIRADLSHAGPRGSMKITEVRPLVMGTPWRNLTFVVVETDEGLTGFGEVRMINNTDAVLGYLAEAVPRHVLGRDPFE